MKREVVNDKINNFSWVMEEEIANAITHNQQIEMNSITQQ